MIFKVIKPLLFKVDPEKAHHLALRLVAVGEKMPGGLRRWFACDESLLATTVSGLNFANPVGIAAGYDKNAQAMGGLAGLGCGHVEVGTITRLPQVGNPRPRIFRLAADGAVINRMGFPNEGIDAILPVLEQKKGDFILGVNIGKGKATPLTEAVDDYAALVKRVRDVADYITVNISSPNTVGLRDLQGRAYLDDLLQALMPLCGRVPLMLKIAPDLSLEALDDVIDVALSWKIGGLIATNTTLGRDNLTSKHKTQKGGMSGKPLRAASTQVIRHIYRQTNGKMPIIGVGGIDSAAAALEKIQAGASLVQLFSGLVYQGPSLACVINRGLAEAARRAGVTSIAELVGTEGDGKLI